MIAACLILAGGARRSSALWSRLTEPTVAQFDRGRTPADGRRRARNDDARSRPGRCGSSVIGRWPSAGSRVCEHPHAAAIEQYVAKQRFLQKTLLAIAGVLSPLWRRSPRSGRGQTGRQGDKETRR